MRKHKKTICITKVNKTVDIIFVINGTKLEQALHYRFLENNILDCDLFFKNFVSAQEDFERCYPDANKLGYAVFVRYDTEPEGSWLLFTTFDAIDGDEL